MTVQPGTTLQGRYTVERILGRGGMGCVYLARMQALGGKKVALKQMTVPGDDPAWRARVIGQFEREARILALLDHPGLVDVTDYFVEDETPFLVMAYVDGTNLQDVLEGTSEFLAETRVVDWALQLCDVLQYLHLQHPPVVFRDLKPSNVMLDSHGRVRLIDFGIARVFDDRVATSTAIRGAGTPGFSPVEQFAGTQTDPRSDVFALGATLYTLLTRTVPPTSLALIAGEAVLSPPCAINAAVSPRVNAAILRMMGLRKEERLQGMTQVRQALLGEPDMSTPPAGATGLGGETLRPAPCTTCGHPVPPGAACTACTRQSAPQTPPAPSVRQPRRLHGAAWLATSALLLGGIWWGQSHLWQGPSGGATLPPVPTPAPAAAPVGHVTVQSTPGGAQVSLDGHDRGVTPLLLADVPTGSHVLRLHLKAYQDSRADLQVTAGDNPPVEVSLRALDGRLMVSKLPAHTSVRVDGRPVTVDARGLVDLALPVGPHVLQVERTGCLAWHTTVQVPPGATATAVPHLVADAGAVAIGSTPSGARVLLDHRKVGATPLTLHHVRPGSHSLQIERDGYRSYQHAVSVVRGRTAVVTVTLTPIPRPQHPVVAPPPRRWSPAPTPRPRPAVPVPAPTRYIPEPGPAPTRFHP